MDVVSYNIDFLGFVDVGVVIVIVDKSVGIVFGVILYVDKVCGGGGGNSSSGYFDWFWSCMKGKMLCKSVCSWECWE